MIKERCFSKDWLVSMSKKYRYNDIGIIEKVIRAYSLLDLLARSGCPYIFKGGTSVGLILGDNTRRLSIDIDIICPPGTDIEQYLDKIKDFGFIRTELIERRQAGKDVPKSHSKFFYQIAYTDRANQESYILLDVLYEDTHYIQVDELPVINRFIELDSEPSIVKVPSVGDILGDKLTAFAPNTTGIPYYKNNTPRPTEIMKQVYDIGRLFDVVDSLEITSQSFQRIADVELGYRNLGSDKSIIYNDIRQTSLLIATRGLDGVGDFSLLQDGIKRLGSFIYESKYFIEDAIVDAAKASYVATCIENGITEVVKYDETKVSSDMKIGVALSTRLNKLKKIRPEAFYYWWLIDDILANKQTK
ncbi:MAG: nucleotidyl transferase AbiEii/AbiGii toxin family protein [Muribaculaceae bacterium]|nr:nucleotidyl transferase AbiEii/AbiGii toxin family protein [Muribaculaceae bacterium]